MLGIKIGKKGRRVGLALGGGGIRGIAAVPVLKVLDDLGIEVSRVAGTSMGAILGALYALGLSGAEIESRVRDHIVLRDDTLRAIYHKRKHLLRWLRLFGIATERGGILSADGAFKHLFGEISARDFADTRFPFCAVATDFWTGSEVVLDSGPLLPAIKASMALPGIFHPIQRGDQLLVDGGLVNNCPYDRASEGVDFCIAVDVMAPPAAGGQSREVPSAYESLLGAVDIMQVNALKLRLQQRSPDILVQPDIEHVRLLDFPQIEYVLERGEQAAARLRSILQEQHPQLTGKD